MSRDFAAVEARIDRGLTKVRRQAESAALVHKADSTVKGYLGGLSEASQPDACRTLIIRASEAYVALLGLEDAHATLSYLTGVYAPDIAGPRDAARQAATNIFKEVSA